MPIRIDEFSVTVPDGAIIGVIGTPPPSIRLTCGDPLDLLVRRQQGETIFVPGIDPRVCDEGWWISDGRLRRGDPAEVLREAGRGEQVTLVPSLVRGDGRAKLVSIETLGEDGAPTSTWRCGERATVRVTVAFLNDVPEPVVGIMIRTRLGFEVYGTNTELEQLRLGPVTAGTTLAVTFAFECALCPQEYTLTAASHDPNGAWHDWREDAIAFRVADNRYTAGVANLRAQVTSSRA